MTAVKLGAAGLAAGVGFVGLGQPELLLRLASQADGLPLIVGVLFAAVAGIAGLVCYFEYHGIGPQDGIVRRGSGELPVIALSFDDGPSPIYTPAILEILAEKDVSATFFVTGRHAEKYPAVIKRMATEGHEIGNHTYTHRDLVPVSRRRLFWEIRRTERVIRRITGRTLRLFRPPRGIYSNAVRRALVEDGYTLVLWSVSSADWCALPPEALTRRVLRYARNGAIILFHDSGALVKREGGSRAGTVKALPAIIEQLQAQGFQLVTVGELIELSHVTEEHRYLAPAEEF